MFTIQLKTLEFTGGRSPDKELCQPEQDRGRVLSFQCHSVAHLRWNDHWGHRVVVRLG